MNYEFKKYLIVGNGRLAKHLSRYFTLLNLPYTNWFLGSENKFEEKLVGCTHVLLAISDSAIERFYTTHTVLKEKKVIHFSGALSIDGIYGVHPLMTFTHQLYELEDYKKIFFIVEGKGISLFDLMPGLENRFVTITKEQKPYYHALCVMGGNFPVILWKKMISEFEHRLGIPREAAWPYLERVFKEFIKNPEGSLTGPLTRGDWGTIDKNLESLKDDDFKPVYEALLGV